MVGIHAVPFHHLISILAMAFIMSKGMMRVVTIWNQTIPSGIGCCSSIKFNTRTTTPRMISADATSIMPRMLMETVDVQVSQ